MTRSTGNRHTAFDAKPYERVKAWQACHELALAVYRSTRSWPATERYGLVSQTRRAAFSAAANIAEGAARRGSREFSRFLDNSLGSLAELSYFILLAKELRLGHAEQLGELEALCDHASRITWGLYRVVSNKAAGQKAE